MNKQQQTGMRGVYLVAAELSRLGFIASPTSRSAMGADILITDQSCQKTYSVQVKTNSRVFNFWLLNKKTKEHVSRSHIYALVNIRKSKSGEMIEYYLVPSKVIADKMIIGESKSGMWYTIDRKDIDKYKDNWSIFRKP